MKNKASSLKKMLDLEFLDNMRLIIYLCVALIISLLYIGIGICKEKGFQSDQKKEFVKNNTQNKESPNVQQFDKEESALIMNENKVMSFWKELKQ